MKTFVLNRRKALSLDFVAGKDIKVEYCGFGQLTIALENLAKEDLKWAKKMLRTEAKPLAAAMKGRIKTSKKDAFTTQHRHFSKGSVTEKINKHKPGELRRSVGILTSKKYRNKAMIYVGPRSGSRYANDGYYRHFVEFGTEPRVPTNKKWMYSVQDGQLIRFNYAKGMKADPFFAPAMQSKGPQVFASINKKIMERQGRKWENGGRA